LKIDFGKIKTYSIKDRKNLVTYYNLKDPEKYIPDPWENPDFDLLIDKITEARKKKRPVIMFMGAHVIKNGLSKYIISLVNKGYVTHLAGNGATSIHDFELALIGGTSEDVPTAIKDGSFGMWEETGRMMNEAIQQGAKKGLGYGQSLYRYVQENEERFLYKDICVFYQAQKAGIPVTYHVTIGTDIIHQHPIADFGAIGKATGEDFKLFCESVADLDNGVFLNFGSAVTGAEVFLKALSISRNLGYPTYRITTANFDLIDLGDYRSRVGYDNPHYYYRPLKNIVTRPVSDGGTGWHFCVDHNISIPKMYHALTAREK
jgi:hypothetical protein